MLHISTIHPPFSPKKSHHVPPQNAPSNDFPSIFPPRNDPLLVDQSTTHGAPSCVAGRGETGSEGRSKVPRSANFKRIRPRASEWMPWPAMAMAEKS